MRAMAVSLATKPRKTSSRSLVTMAIGTILSKVTMAVRNIQERSSILTPMSLHFRAVKTLRNTVNGSYLCLMVNVGMLTDVVLAKAVGVWTNVTRKVGDTSLTCLRRP